MQPLPLVLWTLLNGFSGEPVTLDAMAEALAPHDVVFLGELHDSTPGHAAQLTIIKALHARRGEDLVLSMEMFERDVQPALDDYLAGRIDEGTFLAHARPWGNYAKHYRPIIEWAKAQGVPVLAANVPQRAASAVSGGGLEALEGMSFVASRVSTPKDRYWREFRKAMDSNHGGLEGEALERFYAAQCLRDDTMAETIVAWFEGRPWRTPQVVHLCGRFHSDHGLGTVVRTLQRRPLLRCAVVTMHRQEDGEEQYPKKELGTAHFAVIVPPEAKSDSKPVSTPEAMSEAEASAASPAVALDDLAGSLATAPAAKGQPIVKAQAPRASVVSGKPTVRSVPATKATAAMPLTPALPAPNSNARPALGFKPDYAADGLVIDYVLEGGAAERSGLEDGDKILEIDGEEMPDLETFMDVMQDLKVNQTIKVILLRDGKRLTKSVKLLPRRSR